jgi:hypothetical protein
LPAISRLSLAGSQLGSKAPKISVEKLAFTEVDLDLPDLFARRRPGERGVDADDVAALDIAVPPQLRGHLMAAWLALADHLVFAVLVNA